MLARSLQEKLITIKGHYHTNCVPPPARRGINGDRNEVLLKYGAARDKSLTSEKPA